MYLRSQTETKRNDLKVRCVSLNNEKRNELERENERACNKWNRNARHVNLRVSEMKRNELKRNGIHSQTKHVSVISGRVRACDFKLTTKLACI